MTEAMRNTCLGLFAEPQEADKAVDELQEAGIRKEDISIIVREESRPKVPSGRRVEVSKDAAAGVATGGAIGGIAGLIIGIVAIAVPGLGLLVAAGPLAVSLGLVQIGGTTLAGAITGAAAGGIIGGLVGLGVPEERAKAYEEAIRKGQILLAVGVTPDNQEKVREIFSNHGASQVCNIGPK